MVAQSSFGTEPVASFGATGQLPGLGPSSAPSETAPVLGGAQCLQLVLPGTLWASASAPPPAGAIRTRAACCPMLSMIPHERRAMKNGFSERRQAAHPCVRRVDQPCSCCPSTGLSSILLCIWGWGAFPLTPSWCCGSRYRGCPSKSSAGVGVLLVL